MMFTLPLATMLAVIICFGRMAADNELLALKAAGIGSIRILPPVLIFAISISIMAVYSNTELMPKGLRCMKALILQLAREKIDRVIKEKSFSSELDDIVVYVEQVDPATGHWRNIYIFDDRNRKQPLIVTAREAGVKADYVNMALTLDLKDGSMDYLDEILSRNVRFHNYSLTLPVSLSNPMDFRPENRIEMSQDELLTSAKKWAAGSAKCNEMMIEYHQRLILASSCFVLALLGLPLAVRSRPGRRQSALPLGLFIFFFYYLLFSLAESIAEQSTFPVGVVLWTPNILFIIPVCWASLQMDRESSPGMSNIYAGILDRFYNRLARFRK